MILVIDTAQKEARLALALDNKVEQYFWDAGRELSASILVEIEKLYKKVNQKIDDTEAIIVNSGPGSFTGLRIGISIANSFAYALDIPIVGVDHVSSFEELVTSGKKDLTGKKGFEKAIEPVYGAEPNITQSKK
jgi:tRNA threonylcarbamoyladenosine biosynthesis protein TsaB